MIWNLRDLAAELGTLIGEDADVSAVSTDSRSVNPGDLFVAIEGEFHDGHNYVGAAMESGATAVLTKAGRAEVVPRIEVADTRDALLALAAIRRRELVMPVVAVTGSTGKTTTKDMLASAIPGSWVSPASFNNEVGVPLTVLQTPQTADALVVEMGSRGRGHLRWLMPAVRPDVAVITNLGVVHLETFGDAATLADAKWEIVEGLESEGTAVLPALEPRLAREHRGRTVTFAVDAAADVVARDVHFDEGGRARFTLAAGDMQADVRLRLAGIHQPANAAAAAAAALAIGTDLEAIAIGLSAATGSKWRMEIHEGAFTVVNDAYNANPTSLESALRTVLHLGGRPVAVLGKMAELGDIEEAEHIRIGRLAATLGFAAVIMVGEDPGLAAGAGSIARRVDTAAEAMRVLESVIRSGDTVLVKASRSVGLEGLAEQLIESAGTNAGSVA